MSGMIEAMENSAFLRRPKKILHLRSTFHAGGTENLIVHFFNRPSAAFEITLVLMKPGPLMHSLAPSANRVVRLYRKQKFDLRFLGKLARLVAGLRPDYIHTHQPIELFYAFLMKCFFPGVKLIHQVHLYNPRANWGFFLEKFIVRYLARRLVVVSRSLEEQLASRGYPLKKMTVLPNIVQRTHHLSAADKAKFRHRINLQPGEALIGMIGNFVPEKDQATLARAFRMIMEDFPNAKLVFIGKESPEQQACKQVFRPEELEKRAYFIGPWRHASELLPLFALSVFSSRQETFGMAAIESLLYEVPLIASDIPVMRELSLDGRHFELFETGNATGLARRLRDRLSRPPDRQKLEQARKYAEKAFNAETYIHQLDQLYHS